MTTEVVQQPQVRGFLFDPYTSDDDRLLEGDTLESKREIWERHDESLLLLASAERVTDEEKEMSDEDFGKSRHNRQIRFMANILDYSLRFNKTNDSYTPSPKVAKRALDLLEDQAILGSLVKYAELEDDIGLGQKTMRHFYEQAYRRFTKRTFERLGNSAQKREDSLLAIKYLQLALIWQEYPYGKANKIMSKYNGALTRAVLGGEGPSPEETIAPEVQKAMRTAVGAKPNSSSDADNLKIQKIV